MRRLSTRPDRCPRFPFDWLDPDDGDLFPASCKSVRCEVCGGREIRKRARRAALARPERFVTLTALPAKYQDARRAEQRLLKALRRRGFKVEWLMAHELTKSGLRHGHALQKGDPIPQRLLSTLAEQSGMGRVVWIERVRDDGAVMYGLKEALRVVDYATKGTAELEEHLDLNGGRLYRATRGYWADA